VALSISSSPAQPILGDEITLILAGGTGDPDFARFQLTSVPSQSGLSVGMLVDAEGNYVQTFTPDVPGEYIVKAYDVEQRFGLSGFESDAQGPRERVLGSRSATIRCAQAVDLPIVTTPGHNVTVRLGVLDAEVISAAFVDPTTDLARLATIDTAVVATLTPILEQEVGAIGSPLTTRAKNLRVKYEAHRVMLSGVHSVADSTNVTSREPSESDESAIALLNELYDRIVLGHMQAEAAGGTWHAVDDTKNLPVTPRATTKASAHVLACDLEERVYERHRVQTSPPVAHGNQDTVNGLDAPKPLTNVVVAFLDFIADNASTSVSGENTGAIEAARKFGMRPA
jgi:hypothetical protein